MKTFTVGHFVSSGIFWTIACALIGVGPGERTFSEYWWGGIAVLLGLIASVMWQTHRDRVANEKYLKKMGMGRR